MGFFSELDLCLVYIGYADKEKERVYRELMDRKNVEGLTKSMIDVIIADYRDLKIKEVL